VRVEGKRERRLRALAEDLHCGVPLARDLLKLAGDDANLVREASEMCAGVESVKVYIIDKRFNKIEQ
jgi:hypothetical protein